MAVRDKEYIYLIILISYKKREIKLYSNMYRTHC